MANIFFEKDPESYVGDYPSFTVHFTQLDEKEKALIVARIEGLIRDLKEKNYGERRTHGTVFQNLRPEK
jgi:hypothetical protein